jgi:hypothetical protein
MNPDAFKPYTVKVIKRDYKDPGGATAKTVVQELIVQEKVDIHHRLHLLAQRHRRGARSWMPARSRS